MLKKKYYKTNDDCEVTFEFDSEKAQTVALVSEFNGWSPVDMKRRKKDGVFFTKIRVPKDSQFQFRYLVDEQTWVNDPAADSYVPNQHGSENGVVFTAPSAN